jgi:hypothetical protein
MRSQWKVLLGTLALGPVLVWGPELPGLMSRMETFRVSDVEVRGVRFLSQDSVVAQMRIDPGASVWADTDTWVHRLTEHPLIRDAQIRRRLPNGVRVTVEEREPIALAATPVLEPLDAEGHRLPIDPSRYRLDLPVIATGPLPAEGASLFPSEVRSLAAELAHLRAANAEFAGRVSAIRRDGDDAIVATVATDGSAYIDFVLPSRVSPARIREGEMALAHATLNGSGDPPAAVDLRFADQIVVRRTGKD